MIPLRGLTLALLIPAFAPAPIEDWQDVPAGRRTASDPHARFSITFPDGWRSQALSDGDWSQVGLFASHPRDVSILIGARPLRSAEAGLETEALLDHLIERTMTYSIAFGNAIVQVGHVEPVVGDWPAFAVVATNADRSKMITVLRSVVADRLVVVTTLTDNLQGSPELAAVVTAVVDSLEIHSP